MATRKIFENFYIENNIPLDAKSIVSSLNNLIDEIPLIHRYYGLLFFNEEDKKYYTFKNSLLTPEILISDNNASTIFGITVSNYSNLISELNNYSTLGKLIYVAGLDVIFKFNGTNWKYYSGIYKFNSYIELNNFPNSLKEKNILVNIEGSLKLFDENLELTNYLTRTNNQTNLDFYENENKNLNDKYYIHKNQLYKTFQNKLWKVGSEVIYVKNKTINIGLTLLHEINISEIGDVNKPPYINAIFWINTVASINNFNQSVRPVKLEIIYTKNDTTSKWEVYCESDLLLTGDLELQF